MRRAWLVALYALSVGVIAWLAWRGRSYYALPLALRPRHPLHWELKPGGTIGRWFGIAGFTALLAMLLYSVRKRVARLRRWGALRTWLDGHIYLGIIGPLLIVLHSALKVSGLIAVAFWSMVAVATSGIFGRFLYAQIPRSAAGDQLSLDEAQALERALTERLRGALAVSPAGLERFERDVRRERPAGSLLAELAQLATAPLVARRRFARWRRETGALPPSLASELGRVVRQQAVLRQRLRLWRSLHELFHYWHVLHKPFAVLLYLFAALHVAVAWATGYAWSAG